jgi:hypothetical protein
LGNSLRDTVEAACNARNQARSGPDRTFLLHRKILLDLRNVSCDTGFALHCSISFAAARRHWGKCPDRRGMTAMS